ncbi:MAG: hypothetical protein AAGA48_09510 [Myxococcota bacterium]
MSKLPDTPYGESQKLYKVAWKDAPDQDGAWAAELGGSGGLEIRWSHGQKSDFIQDP